jgi:hypothetical protein
MLILIGKTTPASVILPLAVHSVAERGMSKSFGGKPTSSVGTEDQLTELLQAAAIGKVAPSIEVFDFSAVPTYHPFTADPAVLRKVWAGQSGLKLYYGNVRLLWYITTVTGHSHSTILNRIVQPRLSSKLPDLR